MGEKNENIKLSKKIIASITLWFYIFALGPSFLFSEIFEANVEGVANALNVVNIFHERKNIYAEKFILSKDGGTVQLGEASIEIPSGALKTDTLISITHLKKVSDTGSSLFNATPNFCGYRFLPCGLEFIKPCVITIPYEIGRAHV